VTITMHLKQDKREKLQLPKTDILFTKTMWNYTRNGI